MLIRAAALDDWALVKEARLRALADSPAAFGSTWAREATFGDDEWQRRVAPGIWLLAVDDERVVGMNALIAEADSPTEERHLVAMWVEPGHRGSQAATLLIEAACAQARDAGATNASDSNRPAAEHSYPAIPPSARKSCVASSGREKARPGKGTMMRGLTALPISGSRPRIPTCLRCGHPR
jgi:GNAT superfamily N-acetyltransferase